MSGERRQRYLMSFGLGGLLVNESLIVARLHVEGEPWKRTIGRAMGEGATSLPKIASNRRTLREITNRLERLSPEERRFLLQEADRTDQRALLWLAACRAYRFVGEFALEVIRERYLSYQFDLPLETFDILFDAKAEWDEWLAGLSASTRKKLRQALFRMLRESDILSADGRIQSALLSPRLTGLVQSETPGELAFFPGIPLMERNT
ncbi:DUF1819 family protein [Aestuariicoccus sp. MJ-SS9]|uniref:DUF1819 family protein n=1 Tax=Aestuariicoccus sp. MJ-SS9 TaxID=3079855 RepID=UPI00290F2B4C|nr:DUF1819 family protein [Aestuariicoccus sp. MJ-SS9]MDU8911583.1 DUF1819 family protein [Aestuariicoccus sp. MJ-SS9]